MLFMLEVHHSHKAHSCVLSVEGQSGMCFLRRHGANSGFAIQPHSYGAAWLPEYQGNSSC